VLCTAPSTCCRPRPDERPALASSVEGGPDDYGRIKVEGHVDGTHTAFGGAAVYTHDGGWRDDSGFNEAKANLTLTTSLGDTPARFDLAWTDLDQEDRGLHHRPGCIQGRGHRAQQPEP
jgi:hypothetical protein